MCCVRLMVKTYTTQSTHTSTFMQHIVFISTEKNQRIGDNVHVKEYDLVNMGWDGMGWDATKWYRYSVLSIFLFFSFYVFHRISFHSFFFLFLFVLFSIAFFLLFLSLFDRCCDVRHVKATVSSLILMLMLYM